jgi:hypothetical protein
LSKTGSPRPGGTPRATHSTTPPSESPRRRARVDALHLGGRLGVRAAHRVRLHLRERDRRRVDLGVDRVHLPHPGQHLDTGLRRSSLRAIAAAATRPIVSRALARPPPCQLRMPYLASVV